MSLLLGIDVGTSAVKAGIFTATGELRGLGRIAYPVCHPHPGWAECDPEVWWSALCRALRAACRAARCRPSDLRGVGVGVLFPCVTPLDAAGRSLYPALLYNDQRSLPQIRHLLRRLPRAQYERRTGNVIMPGTSAVTSLRWLLDEQPVAMKAARWFGWTSTCVTSRLTGEFAVDGSMAALSGLVRAEDPWQWDPVLCDVAGVPPDKLPPIRAVADIIGTVSAAAARATGLRPGTPVICGCGDVPAAAFGAGVRDGAELAYVAGSTDCVSWPRTSPAPGLTWVNCAYLRPGNWLAIGTSTSAGVSVDWFCREVLGTPGPAGVKAMTALARQSPAGSHGVVFLPYLQGERTPVWDPQAQGLFFGVRSSTTRADLARAVFEGTAFALRDILQSLAARDSGPPPLIRAVGGCTANTLWNQVKSDVLGCELRIPDFQATGILGAALPAGVASGAHASLAAASAVARAAIGTKPVLPDPQTAEVYADRFAVYRQLYPRLRRVMRGQR